MDWESEFIKAIYIQLLLYYILDDFKMFIYLIDPSSSSSKIEKIIFLCFRQKLNIDGSFFIVYSRHLVNGIIKHDSLVASRLTRYVKLI